MHVQYLRTVVRRRRLLLVLAAPFVWPSSPVVAAGGAAGAASSPSAGKPSTWLEVWVVLSLPDLASLPRERGPEREALRERILLQQDQVMAGLLELGAVELARVQLLRNALAVRLPAAQLPAARSLPGVQSVRLVRNVDRAPPAPRS